MDDESHASTLEERFNAKEVNYHGNEFLIPIESVKLWTKIMIVFNVMCILISLEASNAI